MPPERGIRIMRAIHMKRESRTRCAAFDVESRRRRTGRDKVERRKERRF